MSREGAPITYSSVLKTVGQPYTSKSIDLRTNQVTQVTVEPATEEEIDNTVKVMGGEDWQDWIAALDEAGVLADGAVTVAYSYIGPELTFPIYRNGSIGMAKRHLSQTAATMTKAVSYTHLDVYKRQDVHSRQSLRHWK